MIYLFDPFSFRGVKSSSYLPYPHVFKIIQAHSSNLLLLSIHASKFSEGTQRQTLNQSHLTLQWLQHVCNVDLQIPRTGPEFFVVLFLLFNLSFCVCVVPGFTGAAEHHLQPASATG